jgi:hypothetical protein
LSDFQARAIRLATSGVICGMLESVSSVGPGWVARNRQVLTAFGPLLIVTGLLGFVLPPDQSLMSGAAPYNVFHIIAGCIGLGLVLTRRLAGVVAFNLVFGLIDLYQAAAGLAGWFPAQLFGLRPADHLVHVLVGLFLVAVGYLGKQAS